MGGIYKNFAGSTKQVLAGYYIVKTRQIRQGELLAKQQGLGELLAEQQGEILLLLAKQQGEMQSLA
jgi:hypothetical protein